MEQVAQGRIFPGNKKTHNVRLLDSLFTYLMDQKPVYVVFNFNVMGSGAPKGVILENRMRQRLQVVLIWWFYLV